MKHTSTDTDALISTHSLQQLVNELGINVLDTDSSRISLAQANLRTKLAALETANKSLFERKVICAGLAYVAENFLEGILLTIPAATEALSKIPLEPNVKSIIAGTLIYLTLNKLAEPFIKLVTKIADTIASLEWHFLKLISNKFIVIPALAVGIAHYLKPELGTAKVLTDIMQFIQDNQIHEFANNFINHPYAPITISIFIGLLTLGLLKGLANKVQQI